MADGTPDPNYGTNGKVIIPFDLGGDNNDTSYSVALQSDGKLLVTGTLSTVPTSTGGSIGFARLDTNGQLDPSFGFIGKKVYQVNGFSQASVSRIHDNRLVFGGFTIVDGDETFLAGRVIIDTIFDNGFQ